MKSIAFLICKTCKCIVKTKAAERLQVEDVNGKRCQGNIKIDTNNNTKINEKTMLDLCSTNNADNIGKGFETEARREPTNSE